MNKNETYPLGFFVHFKAKLSFNIEMEKLTAPASSIQHSHSNSMKALRPSRILIDRVTPEIDKGRFPAKRYIDEEVKIMAVLLVDGHDMPKGRVLYRHAKEKEYKILPLIPKGNDEWVASFRPEKLGRYLFTVEAAMDRFGTWSSDTLKKLAAGQDVKVDLQTGVALLQTWTSSLRHGEKDLVQGVLGQLEKWIQNPKGLSTADLSALLKDPALELIAHGIFDEGSAVRYSYEVPLQIEPEIARFSSWYEFFPRSVVEGPLRHGTFKDAEARLPYIKDLGFNVVYFPPIHPIGTAFRKGKNNTLDAKKDDVGSPWAIGSQQGGHKDLLPDLGSFADFERLLKKAKSLKLEMALDLAFQCSPDHPYVKEHPQWFKQRPDGTIQYAENPPKKYQDIYPFDFESQDWQALWEELRSVVLFWIEKGIRVFRVDNPHTKPFHFWEWLIQTVREQHPEVIFLAEAFTRPKIMAYLAKAGFSQSYTYFTWRNVKWEITQYMEELTKTELADYYGANFWPNTPDILPKSLQKPDATIYMQRLVLAATLTSNYGLYGPVYELMDSAPFKKDGEEYLNSEKYELRSWNLQSPDSLAPFIKKINSIRQSEKSLQTNRSLRFHPVNNESLIAYSKSEGGDHIVVVVNLDAAQVQSGLVELPLIDWNLPENAPYEVYDLITGTSYFWNGWRNFVELKPLQPAHIFKIKKHSKERGIV